MCNLCEYNCVTNMRDGMLDVVLTSPELGGAVRVRAAGAGEELSKVDGYHPPLVVQVEYTFSQQVTLLEPSNINKSRDWNLARANFLELYYSVCNIDWTELYQMSNVNAALEYFYNYIYNIFDHCVPKKIRKRSRSRTYPVFYTKAIIRDIETKAKYHREWRKTKSERDHSEFKNLRSKIKRDINSAYQNYVKRISNNLCNDPSQFWQFVNSLRTRSGLEPKVTRAGTEYSGVDVASAFAEHFESVFLPERPALDPRAASASSGAAPDARHVDVRAVTAHHVCRAMRKLKGHTSAGPDAIPAYVLKGCIEYLAEPITFIFNIILDTGEYPDTWKESRVTPIPKKGSKTMVENYRPVAILCALAKVFEMVLHDRLLPQCQPHITGAQHAFLPQRSVATNLVTIVDILSYEIDAGNQVDVVYLDFQKAFDRVDNDILLLKLGAMGFTPRLLKMFSNYLRERKQFVKYGPFISKPYQTLSGISQGSNLGPLLFVILINDLPDVVTHSHILLFADDVKLITVVRSPDDCMKLQHDIDNVLLWSVDNRLFFNPSKCEMMSFTRSLSPVSHQYVIGGTPIVRVTEVRDLGVLFDPQLTFRHHVRKVTNAAFQRLGFVMRNAKPLTSAATQALYAALVRSIVETNAVVWIPHEKKYILMLEQVQKRFLRYLYKKNHWYYPFMYPTRFLEGHLGYDSLELRRNLALVGFILNIVRNKIDCVELVGRVLKLFVPDRYLRARSHPLLVSPPSRTNLYRRSPVAYALALLGSLLAEAPQCDLFVDAIGRLLNICKGMLERGMPISSVV